MATSMSVQNRESTSINPIIQSAAGYTGVTATLLYTAPATGSADVYLTITTNDTTTVGNLIRLFRLRNSIKTPVGQPIRYDKRLKDADIIDWQKPIPVGPIRLNNGEALYASQEKNDTCIIIDVDADLFQ